MPNFDFHLHPVFKRFICNFEADYPTRRAADELLLPIDLRNPITDFLEENFLHILESQSCVAQMEKGQLLLGVANIAPIEEMFAATNSFFGKILHSRFFTSPVDQQYFDLIRDRKISYYQLLIRELNLYRQLMQDNKIRMFCRKNASWQDGEGVMLAMGLEGGHCLCRTLIRRPGEPDTMIIRNGGGDAISKDFIDNPVLTPAESLRHLQKAMWEENMDICYLILTHLSYIPEQFLATHAFGMKMIEHEAVYPCGNGITQAGKDVIDAAYTLKVDDKRATVLIDIKHMGLKSRLDLYAYRKEKNYEAIPLIASHVGVTGYSIQEWKSALEECRLLVKNGIPYAGVTMDRKMAGKWGAMNNKFTFNGWSINLMDEDIEEVLKSGGLIGISLDVRILGWQDITGKGDKEEFLSWEDFRYFFPEKAAALSKGEEVFKESRLIPTKEERHPLALCFNILHIAAVARLVEGVKDPFKQVCIGSDYDGLINPIINCRDAGDMPALERNLLKWMPVAESAYLEENGGERLLPLKSGKLDMAALRGIISDILYENGKAFLQRWTAGKW